MTVNWTLLRTIQHLLLRYVTDGGRVSQPRHLKHLSTIPWPARLSDAFEYLKSLFLTFECPSTCLHGYTVPHLEPSQFYLVVVPTRSWERRLSPQKPVPRLQIRCWNLGRVPLLEELSSHCVNVDASLPPSIMKLFGI